MYPLIKQNGPGTYAVSFWVYVSAYTDGSTASAARLIIRGQAEDANSFISGHSDGNYYCVLNPGSAGTMGQSFGYLYGRAGGFA